MKLKTLIPLLALALMLAACGPTSSPGSSSRGAAEIVISGQVIDDDGPAKGARIEAKDSKGSIVARSEIHGDAHYSLKLPAATVFPVVLSAVAEGTSDPLKAVVTNDLVAEQDISPVTTIVVNTAMSLGGLTEANLAKAAGAAISQRKTSGGAGGSAGFKGDPTKQYGGWH